MKSQSNPIITLTTDFGTRDSYVASIKGVILSINPYAIIVDISHEIKPFDIYGCSYFLSTFYKFYPPNTIHVVVVDPGVGSSRKPLLLKLDEHYFIGPDNGIFTSVYRQAKHSEIYLLNNTDYFLAYVSTTFHGRDIFAPVSANLSINIPPDMLGEKMDEIILLNDDQPKIEPDRIIGKIIYTDRFGNLITNISGDLLDQLRKISIGNIELKDISCSYDEAPRGTLLAIIGSSGLLEISVNMGSAEKLIGSTEEVVCFMK